MGDAEAETPADPPVAADEPIADAPEPSPPPSAAEGEPPAEPADEAAVEEPAAEEPAEPPPPPAAAEEPSPTTTVEQFLHIADKLPMGAEGADARDQIFASADADSDGTLTLEEAQAGLPQLLGAEAVFWGAALEGVLATGFPVVSDVAGGISREGFWKLCVYLRRHCELSSALGYASTAAEYEAAKNDPISEDVYAIAEGKMTEWSVPPPEGGLVSLDTDADGIVTLAELSSYVCSKCVVETLTEELTTPEEPIEIPPEPPAQPTGEDGAYATEPQPPEPEELPEELKALSGHVEGLQMPSSVSKQIDLAQPGLGKDRIRDQRKTKVADVGSAKAIGDLSDSLVENTAMGGAEGRGLNVDAPKRSKILPIRKQQSIDAPALPSLRVAEETDQPVDADALRMDPERKALAAQFGFGEVVPVPTVPTHAPTGWTPMPVRSERHALAPPKGGGSGYPSPTRRAPGEQNNFAVGGARDDAGSLGVMAKQAVATVQAEQAVGYRPVRRPPVGQEVDAVAVALARGGQSAPALTQGSPSKLTWESLEEMSFEELVKMDAKADFQMPPLPEFKGGKGGKGGGGKGPSKGPAIPPPAAAKPSPKKAPPPAAKPQQAPPPLPPPPPPVQIVDPAASPAPTKAVGKQPPPGAVRRGPPPGKPPPPAALPPQQVQGKAPRGPPPPQPPAARGGAKPAGGRGGPAPGGSPSPEEMKAYLAAVQAQQKEYLAYLQAQMSAAQQQQGGAKGVARGGPPARGKPGGKASPGPPGTLQPPPGVAPPYPVPGQAVANKTRQRGGAVAAAEAVAEPRGPPKRGGAKRGGPAPPQLPPGYPPNYGPPPGYGYPVQ